MKCLTQIESIADQGIPSYTKHLDSSHSSMQTLRALPRKFSQALDRTAITLMVVLAVLIGILILSGDRSAPRVRDFTWDGKQIGADDKAFLLTFSRPMDHASVEQNLRIEPKLLGKVSWAGRRMAYTLDAPAPYGTNFQISLQGARDRFSKAGADRATIQSFNRAFRTRDRAFAYIGTEGDETGRLILYNLTKQEKKVLTSEDLTVMDFKPYPTADKILFSAIERHQTFEQPLIEQKLYTVTTGIAIEAPKQLDGNSDLDFLQSSPSPTQAGTVALVLDNQDYQNLKFDLSANGQVIVVQRVNRKNANDSGPWVIRGDEPAKALETKQLGGDFVITPDSDSIAIVQGQGLAILPLKPQADPLNFLPKFGNILGFSEDGTMAAMVKFNTDYTRSLFLVTNQGLQKEVLKLTGSILKAQFDPNKQTLYCLLTNLVPGKTYQEQPFFAAIDLKAALDGKSSEQILRPLLLLPMQREIQVSLSPDGGALLFDQTQGDDMAQAEGKPIENSRLWLLPLSRDPNVKTQPEMIPLPGLHPRWIP